MTKHLTKSFVDLRGLRFTAQAVTELCFDHTEGCLNVAALVIPLKEELAVELVVVIHPSPKFGLRFLCSAGIQGPVWPKPDLDVCSTIDLERDERRSLMVNDRLQIRRRQIRFVGANFLHHEASARRFNERLKILRVVRVTRSEEHTSELQS